MMSEIENIVFEWKKTVAEFWEKAQKMSESETSSPISEKKWSAKETIGHLIDSAANNHQRFVRAQFENNLRLPAYEQKKWVDSQGYREVLWTNLLSLWHEYNFHLCRVVSRIPEEALDNLCFIGQSDNPVTLKFVVEDYVVHLKHHLGQILPD